MQNLSKVAVPGEKKNPHVFMCFHFKCYQDGIKLSEVSENSNEMFLCEPSGQPFLEQFLSHYFSIFDSSRRELLSGTYHKEVLFSLTCCLNWGSASS
jgi:hypothetical protein